MGNLFKEGEVVYERVRPAQKLTIKRYESHLYYCQVHENTKRKELVYSERELISATGRHK